MAALRPYIEVTDRVLTALSTKFHIPFPVRERNEILGLVESLKNDWNLELTKEAYDVVGKADSGKTGVVRVRMSLLGTVRKVEWSDGANIPCTRARRSFLLEAHARACVNASRELDQYERKIFESFIQYMKPLIDTVDSSSKGSLPSPPSRAAPIPAASTPDTKAWFSRTHIPTVTGSSFLDGSSYVTPTLRELMFLLSLPGGVKTVENPPAHNSGATNAANAQALATKAAADAAAAAELVSENSPLYPHVVGDPYFASCAVGNTTAVVTTDVGHHTGAPWDPLSAALMRDALLRRDKPVGGDAADTSSRGAATRAPHRRLLASVVATTDALRAPPAATAGAPTDPLAKRAMAYADAYGLTTALETSLIEAAVALMRAPAARSGPTDDGDVVAERVLAEADHVFMASLFAPARLPLTRRVAARLLLDTAGDWVGTVRLPLKEGVIDEIVAAKAAATAAARRNEWSHDDGSAPPADADVTVTSAEAEDAPTAARKRGDQAAALAAVIHGIAAPPSVPRGLLNSYGGLPLDVLPPAAVGNALSIVAIAAAGAVAPADTPAGAAVVIAEHEAAAFAQLYAVARMAALAHIVTRAFAHSNVPAKDGRVAAIDDAVKGPLSDFVHYRNVPRDAQGRMLDAHGNVVDRQPAFTEQDAFAAVVRGFAQTLEALRLAHSTTEGGASHVVLKHTMTLPSYTVDLQASAGSYLSSIAPPKSGASSRSGTVVLVPHLRRRLRDMAGRVVPRALRQLHDAGGNPALRFGRSQAMHDVRGHRMRPGMEEVGLDAISRALNVSLDAARAEQARVAADLGQRGASGVADTMVRGRMLGMYLDDPVAEDALSEAALRGIVGVSGQASPSHIDARRELGQALAPAHVARLMVLEGDVEGFTPGMPPVQASRRGADGLRGREQHPYLRPLQPSDFPVSGLHYSWAGGVRSDVCVHACVCVCESCLSSFANLGHG